MIRVGIADHSLFFRHRLAQLISATPGFEVVGSARDAHGAIQLMDSGRVDVLILDLEMPRGSAFEALAISRRPGKPPVLGMASFTGGGSEAAMRALQLGAVEILAKDRSPGGLLRLGEDLLEKLSAITYLCQDVRFSMGYLSPTVLESACPLVLVAASTGGPKSLMALFRQFQVLPNFSVVIAQHIPAGFTHALANRLGELGEMSCQEVIDGESPRVGRAYLAPGGRHTVFRADGSMAIIDDCESAVHPSADLLFSSAAKVYGSQSVGCILSGMGRDGTKGAIEIKSSGGYMLAEAKLTCTIYGMPRIAGEAGAIDHEVPIQDMVAAIHAAASTRSSLYAA